MSIESIINGVIAKEGGYVNDPNDRGGATNFGITEAVARATGYAGDMKDLPRAFAVQVYTGQYVVAPGFGIINNISPPIAEELIDSGINFGPKVPSIWLQRTLNVMSQQGKFWPLLTVDGAIGPATGVALTAFLKQRGLDGTKVMLRALNCLQGARYIELAEQRPENQTFVFGWMLGRVEIA